MLKDIAGLSLVEQLRHIAGVKSEFDVIEVNQGLVFLYSIISLSLFNDFSSLLNQVV
jgi:hypothetical protein